MRMTIDNLTDVGQLSSGAVDKQFREILHRAFADILSRPRLEKDRELVITVALCPVCDDHGNLDNVGITPTVAIKLPKHNFPPTVAKLDERDGAVYDDLSPDNPDQSTLPLRAKDKAAA